MKSRPRAVAVLCFLLSSALLAQQQEAAPGNQMTGRVIMEDGSPVPPSAQVELACHGQIRKRVRSYTNGDFRVSLATDNSETPDIAVGGDLFGAKIPFDPRSPTKPAGGGDVGRFDASGCELRAVLPGYQSNVIAVGPRRAMESSEVGRLVLR